MFQTSQSHPLLHDYEYEVDGSRSFNTIHPKIIACCVLFLGMELIMGLQNLRIRILKLFNKLFNYIVAG